MLLNFDFFDYKFFNTFILEGLLFSLFLTLVSILGGFFLGTLICVMRLSDNLFLRKFAIFYIVFFRSVPFVMVILWVFLLVPKLINYPISSDLAAIIAFIIFPAALFAEILRAGIQSISINQSKAGLSLGMNNLQVFIFIIFPVAFLNMLPVLLTQIIIIFQDTSLVYVIGAYDLLKGFEIAGNTYGRPVENYLLAAVFYFLISYFLTYAVRKLRLKLHPF